MLFHLSHQGENPCIADSSFKNCSVPNNIVVSLQPETIGKGAAIMGSNAILFGWNRSVPGRENTSGDHFQEFVAYLQELVGKGAIEDFDIMFLDPHGGDMNGFFLIRGEPSKLDALIASDQWTVHMTRAALHLQGSGAVRGVTGDAVIKRMELWRQHASG